MPEQPIELTTVRTALWQQFGATIDMLENALLACPDTHWNGVIWNNSQAPGYSVFWSIAYHTLFWLDLYLTALPEESFAPPAPFGRHELDPSGALPERPYTKDELHGYLLHLRQKCQAIFTELSEEKANQQFTFPWPGGVTVSYLELQLYSMRHVQEHTAQLSLFLGHHSVPDEALDWVPRAKEEGN